MPSHSCGLIPAQRNEEQEERGDQWSRRNRQGAGAREDVTAAAETGLAVTGQVIWSGQTEEQRSENILLDREKLV